MSLPQSRSRPGLGWHSFLVLSPLAFNFRFFHLQLRVHGQMRLIELFPIWVRAIPTPAGEKYHAAYCDDGARTRLFKDACQVAYLHLLQAVTPSLRQK